LVRFDNSEAPTTATVPLQSDTQSTALSTTEIETNLSFDDEGTPSGSPKLSAAEPFNQIPDFHLSPLPPSAALPTNTLNTSTTQSWTTLSNHPLFLAHPSSLRLNLATAAAMLNGGSARVSATELRQLQLTQQDQFLSANALQARIRDFEASFGVRFHVFSLKYDMVFFILSCFNRTEILYLNQFRRLLRPCPRGCRMRPPCFRIKCRHQTNLVLCQPRKINRIKVRDQRVSRQVIRSALKRKEKMS
jgi:hypothetical protein